MSSSSYIKDPFTILLQTQIQYPYVLLKLPKSPLLFFNTLGGSSMEFYPLYDEEKGFKAMPSSFHDISNVEFKDNWCRVCLKMMEKVIFSANLGMTPNNDGEVLRVTVPPVDI